MKKIRLGWVGTAHDHSPQYLSCILKYPDVFEVIGLVEKREEYLKTYYERFEVFKKIPLVTEEELIAMKPDAVMIEGFELDNVLDAIPYAKAGIHIHLDKPGGENMEDFKTLVEICREKKLVLNMGYMYRYNPAIQFCMEKIADGTIGDVISVEAVMNTEHPDYKREWLSKFKAGNMFWLGCHMVDLIYRIQGKPKRVIPMNRRTGKGGINSVDFGLCLFDYGNAVSIAQASSSEVNGWGRRRLAVVGTKATICVQPIESPTFVAITESKDTVGRNWATTENKFEIKGHGRYDEFVLTFAKMVRGEMENPYTYDYELELQELFLEACKIDD